jgi:hypothetical protein
LRAAIDASGDDPRVEGLVVSYHHVFARPDLEAVNRRWYRREVRAVRLDPMVDVHPFRDAQGFRVGATDRRVRSRLVAASMFHYGYLRSAAALRGRAVVDRTLYQGRTAAASADPALLEWFPGIRPLRVPHPLVARDWVAARGADPERRLGQPRFELEPLRVYVSAAFERITGARPFEFRNYELV